MDQNGSPRIKVAIVGGGMGALAAAWELSRPEHAGRFDVTVYQRGWRLGGKGASGVALDAPDRRIEEHGIHILMGFYRNTFEILEDCYQALAADPTTWPEGVLSWDDVLQPQDRIWVGEPRPAGEWNTWEFNVGQLGPIVDTKNVVQRFFDQLVSGRRQLIAEIDHLVAQLHSPPAVEPSTDASAAAADLAPATGETPSIEELEQTFGIVFANADASLASSSRLRQLMATFYALTAGAMGLIKDGLAKPPHDFSRIDDWDFRDWLRERGPRVRDSAKDVTWNSPIVRAVYDLVFSLDRTVAAGAACSNLLNILFGWDQHVYYKMTAGMGDVVFAPLYLVLARQRNVRFRFFHRATRIEIDPADDSVAAVTFERQIVGAEQYEPLRPHEALGYPVWPNQPWPSPSAAGSNVPDPAVFESESPSPVADTPLTLRRGGDFDAVVLGVSVGALRGALGEELRADARFQVMVNDTRTMPTQAAQLWFSAPADAKEPGGLKWSEGRAMAGYVEPLSSCTEMTQVIDKESFPQPGPRALAYLCGAFPDAPPDRAAALAAVERATRQWLNEHAKRLWTGVERGDGTFDEDALVKRGVYFRANTDPSDQYVLAEAKLIHSRLAADDSGFRGLYLAGDWVRNALNSGCLESAAMGGRQGAAAIVRDAATRVPETPPGNGRIQRSAYVERDGDWVIQPPGMLEDVGMHVFMARADPRALERFCATNFTQPSGGVVEVIPLASSFVMVVFADIARGYSTRRPEDGWQSEKDVTFFMPVWWRVQGGRRRLGVVVPYIYVDNWMGMITGREVYGFPKLLASMNFAPDGSGFEAISGIRERAGADEPVRNDVVVRLSAEQPSVIACSTSCSGSTDLGPFFAEAFAAEGLGCPGGISLAKVPMLFLKQFRDAADPTLASSTEIVAVEARVTRVRAAHLVRGKHELSLPEYDSLHIARTLGMPVRGRVVEPGLALQVDFVLPEGQTLWKPA